MNLLQTLGVASCLGGPMRSCGYAADMLRNIMLEKNRQRFEWHMLHPDDTGSKEEKLSRLNQAISRYTKEWTEQRQPFLVIGGDHSCALGTWGGVLNGLQQADEFGLIWLDAHMDAHTFDTTLSGNIHGMPVSALLGRADKKLATLYPGSGYIKPDNLILIGVRSFEREEYDLLKQAQVTVVFADQIDMLSEVLIGAIDKLSLSCQTIGISIDMDFIDPNDAPGVETPAPGGIKAVQLLEALTSINRHPKICGLEICEFNPENDSNDKTLILMKDIIEAFYGNTLP